MSSTGQETKRKSRLQTLKELIRPPPDPMQRIEDAYGIIKVVGGMRPLFNIRDLEQRRQEISSILSSIEGKTLTRRMQRSVVERTFKLFFLSGSPWYRGLDNRELSSKVAKFLKLYNDIGSLPAFTKDLFMCSMQLLHLSFQALDVTNTPAYIISSTPIIAPANIPRVDLGGSDVRKQQQELVGREEEL